MHLNPPITLWVKLTHYKVRNKSCAFACWGNLIQSNIIASVFLNEVFELAG